MSAGFMIPAANVKRAVAKKARRNKYGNKNGFMAGGIKHASKKQGLRWLVLTQWAREGRIKNLRREVTYRLEVNGKLICKYIADHVYDEMDYDFCGVNVTMATPVVEDVKSAITRKNRAYRIKLKLMKAIHDIEIREV